MKIALFALTGFGNEVLESLIRSGFKPTCLVTRREKGPYPYYPVEDISHLAAKAEVPLYYGAEGETYVLNGQFDVVLAVTYHRKLSTELIQSARYAFNLHPSLLPKYQGASPCYWVLKNGETETGVTAHYLTDEIDRGDIVSQDKIAIDPQDTQGTLRKKLADVSAALAIRVIQMVQAGRLPKVPQDEKMASEFPRFVEGEHQIDFTKSCEDVVREVRARTPWPGVRLQDLPVLNVQSLENEDRGFLPGQIVWQDGNRIRMQAKDGQLLFEVEK